MSELTLIREVITIYGPLALGWVVAFVIWRAYQGRIAHADTVFTKVTDTLNALTSAVAALRDELTRRRQ